MRFALGVDEVGRGPLAGPVAVGVIAVREHFPIAEVFPDLRDSKRMSLSAREKIFRLLRKRVREGDIRYCVRFTGAKRIDEWGITRAVASAVGRGVRFLAPHPEGVSVYLDGLLKAPLEYKQQTIIGGDEIVPIIALASVVAKVMRDRMMIRLAKQFPGYGFEEHKGYGTSKHYEMLQRYGPSAIHRQSYTHLIRG